jgi:hypothetical protein
MPPLAAGVDGFVGGLSECGSDPTIDGDVVRFRASPITGGEMVKTCGWNSDRLRGDLLVQFA